MPVDVSTDGTDGVDDAVVRRYPYPLAATYSRAYFQSADLSDVHEYLMDLYEATLKYCASLVMSQFFQDGLRDPRISRDLLDLQRPSLGHWQGWLRDILALYRRENRALAVPELASFYKTKHTGAILEAAQGLQRVITAMGDETPEVSSGGITTQQFFELLGEYRNRLAHGARPNPRDREHVAELLAPALRQLYAAMAFIAEYRLMHIRSVTLEFDAQRQQRYRYTVTRLIGELPRVVNNPNLIDAAFPSKLIYLLDPKSDFRPLLSLHPLLVLGYCESCNREQTFMLNMSDADRQDYIAYQCTHHFSPTENLDDMRQLLASLHEAAGAAQPTSSAPTPAPAMQTMPPPSPPPPQTIPSPPFVGELVSPPLTPWTVQQRQVASRRHRLSAAAIIALVAGAVAVLGGGGIAFAALNHGKSTASPQDVPSGGGGGSGPPAKTPTPGPRVGTTRETAFATIFIPNGFRDSGARPSPCQNDVITASIAPEAIVYESCSIPAGNTNQSFDAALLRGVQSQVDESAQVCSTGGVKTTRLTVSAGYLTADGFAVCETVSSQNAAPFEAVDYFVTAVGQQPGGGLVGVYIEFFARADQWQTFANGIPANVYTETVFKGVSAG